MTTFSPFAVCHAERPILSRYLGVTCKLFAVQLLIGTTCEFGTCGCEFGTCDSLCFLLKCSCFFTMCHVHDTSHAASRTRHVAARRVRPRHSAQCRITPHHASSHRIMSRYTAQFASPHNVASHHWPPTPCMDAQLHAREQLRSDPPDRFDRREGRKCRHVRLLHLQGRRYRSGEGRFGVY
jgi:hypothetical protein